MSTRRLGQTPRAAVLALALATLASCSVFRSFEEPVPLAEVGFLERAVTDTAGGLTVTVAVPSRDETMAIFGTSLYSARIQPVWVEVENRDDGAYLLMRVGADANYYSPLEASYARRTSFGSENAAMDLHFEALAFDGPIRPGETVDGFVFTQIDEGLKAVHIDLVGDRRMQSFSFLVPIPGLVTDVARVDFEALYDEYEDLEDEGELRAALAALPTHTANRAGTREGDPMNVVMIGASDHVLSALIRRGWHMTEVTYASSAWKTFKSFLFGSQYLYSPISALFAFGRPQDLALQKARGSIHARNHMRLWRTPLNYRGTPVYVGQISRDIGVKLTTRSATLTTHAIDSDVDDTRDGLVGDMAYSQAMLAVGYVPGPAPSTRAAPRENLTGDAYITDGLRAVMFFDERPTSLVDIDILDWELPAAIHGVIAP